MWQMIANMHVQLSNFIKIHCENYNFQNSQTTPVIHFQQFFFFFFFNIK